MSKKDLKELDKMVSALRFDLAIKLGVFDNISEGKKILELFDKRKTVEEGRKEEREAEKPVNCAVCSISPAEIEKMTEQECDDLMYSLNLCVPHMVARIDLKKRFRLYGKARLKEMKRLGDASIWAKSPMEE